MIKRRSAIVFKDSFISWNMKRVKVLGAGNYENISSIFPRNLQKKSWRNVLSVLHTFAKELVEKVNKNSFWMPTEPSLKDRFLDKEINFSINRYFSPWLTIKMSSRGQLNNRPRGELAKYHNPSDLTIYILSHVKSLLQP